MAAPPLAAAAAPVVAVPPYDNKFVTLRPRALRGPPACGHVQRAVPGDRGLRFLEYDEITHAPKAGVALVEFPVAHQQLVFLTFDSPAELFSAIHGDMQCLVRARDLSNAARHLRLVYLGVDYELIKLNLNGTCELAPWFAEPPWRSPPNKIVQYADLKDIKTYAPPPAVGVAPALAPSSATPIRVEVVHTKDTQKLANGQQRWKKMLSNGQEIDKSNALAVKGADVAGLLNLPKPMDWTNPLVTLDPYLYPYAFSLCGSAAEARSGLLQGLNTMFVIQLAAENVQGKDGKANHKAYRSGIEIILNAFDVIGREVRVRGTITDQAWGPCEGMITNCKDQLGRLLRRMKFPAQSPIEEGSICPLWYYNAHKEKRPKGEDSD